MSAQWDPTSNKDQHFFHCFSFWWRWALGGVKDQKKQNSFQILVHIRICNFFFFFLFFEVFSFFLSVPSSSLEESAQIERGASIHPSIRPSVCLCVCLSVCVSVHLVRPCVWTCCVGCFFLLPVPVSCFLSVGGRGRSRKREQYAGQAGTVIWLCTHSWSVHGFQQTAALFPKV